MPRRARLLSVLALLACAGGPRPVAVGDPCARCHMPVADARWGAVLITRTGVQRTYDAIECLAADVNEHVVAAEDIAALWVVPFDAPGTLVAAEAARFLRSDDLRSPMGHGLTAFAPSADPASITAAYGGEVLGWTDVLDVVAHTPAAPGAGRDGHTGH